ncbi:TPA: hypothetical protein R5R88_004491 [Salmonella enterica]|nr:hypothetical protein [Salmonella enterica]
MKITDEKISFFKEWYIKDCVVRNKFFFHFSVRNIKESRKASAISENEVTKGEVGFYLNRSLDDCISRRTFKNMGQMYIGTAPYDDYDEVVCIDDEGHVYARSSGSRYNGMEKKIPFGIDGPLRNIVMKIKNILGRLYIVGHNNSVGYRKGVNEWQSLCLNLPVFDYSKEKGRLGDEFELRDIDGFSHDDLYVVGGKGNVWYFSGAEWERINFPSNVYLETVCCAGDGFVYIGGQSGILFKGRENKWSKISAGGYSLPFEDIVWHAGKVWCTSDYGLWCLDGDTLVPADLPSEIAVAAGHLSVGDGVMLMAGMYGAAWHDGQEWHLLFNSVEWQSDDEAED